MDSGTLTAPGTAPPAGARRRRGAGPLLAAVVAVLLGAVAVGSSTSALERSASASEPAVDPAVEQALTNAATVEVVVRVDDGGRAAARESVLATGGAVDLDLGLIDAFAATVTEEGLERLRALPGVRTVSLDREVSFSEVVEDGGGDDDPPDSFYPETVGADALYSEGYDGSGVGVALVDTGVNEVADLEGRVTAGAHFTGDGDGVDRYGHGTFISGIVAGDGSSSGGEHTGMAPGAHIVPVKISGQNGASDVSQVLAGIQWVVSHRETHDIGVLNLALGTDSTQSWTLDPLNFAVERAWDAGIVVVVSGANLGPDEQTITKPADDPWVIAVGATDSHDTVDRSDDTVADFSSRGPTRADGLAKPDLVAPGVSVVGLRSPGSMIDENYPEARVGDDYFRGSGTSFSAGVVSGAAALLRQAHPDWTPDEVKGALLSTAAAGPVGDRNVDGFGALAVDVAHTLSDPEPANQGLERSTGDGALDASRGTVIVERAETGEEVRDRATGQDQSFDAEEFRTSNWTEENWSGHQWYGHQWYGHQWYGHQWYGHQWYGHQWY